MQPIIGHYIMFPNSYKRFKKSLLCMLAWYADYIHIDPKGKTLHINYILSLFYTGCFGS